MLQKIEVISRPALGTENFTFTHKVSKNIGIWPCWYSATFATTGHASGTWDLNPRPGWWAPRTGHYQLQILPRPATGIPGRVSLAIVLPLPQLPQSVHDITVDDTMSHPIDTQHSWTLLLPKTSSMLVGADVRVGPVLCAIAVSGALVRRERGGMVIDRCGR